MPGKIQPHKYLIGDTYADSALKRNIVVRNLCRSRVIIPARGALIDNEALFAALRNGSIAGAGLDVFEDEPPGEERLKDVPGLVCSAHIGGLSHESIRRMTISATDSVLAVLAGQTPETVINPSVLKRVATEDIA